MQEEWSVKRGSHMR